MKKAFYTLIVGIGLAGMSLTISSCGGGEQKTESIAETKYQCPMYCEDGKTYDKPGSCPVCEMEITEVTGD